MAYNPNNANGQATMANSAPVTLASNQSALPITDNSGSLTVDNAGTFATQESGALLTSSQLIDDAIVADNAAFTDGTTKLDMAGYIYDDVAGTALTENDAAAARIDSKRAQMFVLEDATTRGQKATVSAAGALKVDGSAVTQPVSGTFWQATQPVSGTVTANAGTGTFTISGAVTEATLDAAIVSQGTALGTIKHPMVAGSVTTAAPTYTTGNINPLSLTTSGALRVDIGATSANGTAVKVDNSAVTQPISAASLPLPTGAATAAKQPALGTAGTPSTDVLTVQGAATMTALKVDGSAVTQPVSGTVSITSNSAVNVAQMNGVATSMGSGVSGTGVQRVTLASDQTAISTAGVFSVKVDQTTDGTTNKVSATQATASNLNAQVVGNVASAATDSGNPVKIGGKAVNAEITAVTNAQRVDAVFDLVGKQIVLPYANPENFVSGAITTAMTGTTSTSLVAAPGVGLRNYITTLIVSNSHATVGTDVIIQDGSGGTTLLTIPAASVYGGAVINLPVPLRQPTTNTALFCANVTTGASTKVSAVGYKGV